MDAWEGQVNDLLKDVEVWETKLELSTLEQFEVPCWKKGMKMLIDLVKREGINSLRLWVWFPGNKRF